MLFADAGLSTAQISSLFAIWSITGLALEIPSGVWADATSRRLLLVTGPLLRGAGFALWIIAPSYEAFALGFVLWGIDGALQSGALEALVYEELDRLGAAARYAQLIGRASAAGTLASAAAIGLAAPVFAAGGFAAVGAASVLACLAAAAIAATFPEHRSQADERSDDRLSAYMAILRTCLAEVRSDPSLRAALLLVPAVAAIWGALDEYLPLLAIDTGVSAATVPLLFLVVYVGVAAGGLLGGPASRLTRQALAVLLAAAASALAIGALSGLPSGFVLIAAAFCAFQAVQVVVDARLQDAIDGSARSTVTSLASLATELLVLGVFTGYAAGSAVATDATLFACFATVYVVVAAAILHPLTDRR